ncbi:MAG: TraB/GumN family protein [Bacteroidota bacterium]
MKKLLLCLGVLSFLSTSFLYAQDSDIVIEKTDDTKNALLWKVSGNNLNAPSYVFGTIHMIGKEDYFFTPAMQSAFDSSQAVIFEIKVDDMMNPTTLMSMMDKIMMNGGKSLSDLLTEEEYKLVNAHFEKMGLPLMMLERMKPMFLSAFASGGVSPTGFNSGDIMSYELELMKQAEKSKKPIEGLETMDFQFSLFDSIPYEAQAKMLVDAIKMGDQGGDQFKEMVELYKRQNIEAMQSMAIEDESGLGDYEALLLTQRNENWIPKMKEMMTKATTFFAVGAGHLGGEKGVIQLLEKEGYVLTPVK